MEADAGDWQVSETPRHTPCGFSTLACRLTIEDQLIAAGGIGSGTLFFTAGIDCR